MNFRTLAAAAALALAALPAWAVTTTFDLAADPQHEGWWRWNDDGSHTVSDGVLHVEAPSYYEFFAPADVWRDRVTNRGGWAIETRMRRDPSSVGTPGMWIQDRKYLTLVGFTGSGLEIGDDGAFHGSYAVDTSAFHTYRFEGKGDGLRVFVDGLLALDLGVTTPGWATFDLAFGDNNRFTSGFSSSDWDYVTVTAIPLPAGAWLMGAGLLALAGVAARRRA